MMPADPAQLLEKLLELPGETEIVEFKEAKGTFDFDKLGHYFSALSNEANLKGTESAWLVFGVSDPRAVVGTAFRPDALKLQSLIKELADHTTDRLSLRAIHEVSRQGQHVLLFEIPPALHGHPTAWKGHYYGRDGESLGALNPDERHRIERQLQQYRFETEFAWRDARIAHVLELLDYEGFFQLFQQPLPSDAPGMMSRFVQEKLLVRSGDLYHITNLGAMLFARDLRQFERLGRKAMRVVFYEGIGRTGPKKEQEGQKGYALGFLGIIKYLNGRLPSNEEYHKIRREQVPMYPVLAVKELVANALIHQDFSVGGTSPMVEVFSNRIEVTNPGYPLIDVLRFIDHAPQSRNEALAAMMRRLDFCEERGTGIDRVVEECEKYQLPAPNFIRGDNYTRVILYNPRPLRQMDRRDKVRACYQHACLRYDTGDFMTNQSFRERMGIEEQNYSTASRIIADAIAAGLIKLYDPDNKSKKYTKYIPFWG